MGYWPKARGWLRGIQPPKHDPLEHLLQENTFHKDTDAAPHVLIAYAALMPTYRGRPLVNSEGTPGLSLLKQDANAQAHDFARQAINKRAVDLKRHERFYALQSQAIMFTGEQFEARPEGTDLVACEINHLYAHFTAARRPGLDVSTTRETRDYGGLKEIRDKQKSSEVDVWLVGDEDLELLAAAAFVARKNPEDSVVLVNNNLYARKFYAQTRVQKMVGTQGNLYVAETLSSEPALLQRVAEQRLRA